MFQNHPVQKGDRNELRIMVNEVFNSSATGKNPCGLPRIRIPADQSDKKNLI